MQYLEISLLCKILLSKFWHDIWQLAEAIPSDLTVENMAYVQTCGQTIRFSIWFSHPILIRLKPHRVTATLLNSLNQLWSKLLYMGSSQLNFGDFILNCTLIILFYITFKKKILAWYWSLHIKQKNHTDKNRESAAGQRNHHWSRVLISYQITFSSSIL